MFWILGDNKYAIQALNNFDEDQVLPLGVKVEIDGLMTIKIDELENFPLDKIIYLHDIDTGEYHNLISGEFNAILPTGEYLNRFEVVFSSPNALSIEESELQNIDAFYNNGLSEIIVTNPNQVEIKNIQLFNLTGQTIFTKDDLTNEEKIHIKTNNLSSGVYIIKVNSFDFGIEKKVLVNY